MKPGKRREKMPPFVALPRAMLKESAWRTGLSSSAKIVYVHLKYKFVGTNNGEICLHYSELKDFMASATICRAFKELEVKEWIHNEQPGKWTVLAWRTATSTSTRSTPGGSGARTTIALSTRSASRPPSTPTRFAGKRRRPSESGRACGSPGSPRTAGDRHSGARWW